MPVETSGYTTGHSATRTAQVPQTLFASPLRLSRTGDRLDPESAEHASPWPMQGFPPAPIAKRPTR
ncbi:hypothetical protein BM1_10673 [Bipolaris maydis]|nr:hypothetical protein BM1_10673 [Bipolaris maydis]